MLTSCIKSNGSTTSICYIGKPFAPSSNDHKNTSKKVWEIKLVINAKLTNSLLEMGQRVQRAIMFGMQNLHVVLDSGSITSTHFLLMNELLICSLRWNWKYWSTLDISFLLAFVFFPLIFCNQELWLLYRWGDVVNWCSLFLQDLVIQNMFHHLMV